MYSNNYTLFFVFIVTVVLGTMLSFTKDSVKDLQDQNLKADVQKRIRGTSVLIKKDDRETPGKRIKVIPERMPIFLSYKIFARKKTANDENK